MASSYLNPFLVKKLSPTAFYYYGFGMLSIGGIVASTVLLDQNPKAALIAVILGVAAMFSQVGTRAINGQTSNEVLLPFADKDYALVLSLRNMPAYSLIALLSFILVYFFSGTGSILSLLLLLLIILSVAFAFTKALGSPRTY